MFMESQLAQEVPAEMFAKTLLEQVGPEQLAIFINQLTPEMVLDFLSQDDKTATSPLLQRSGSQWFRRVWDEARRLIGGTPA